MDKLRPLAVTYGAVTSARTGMRSGQGMSIGLGVGGPWGPFGARYEKIEYDDDTFHKVTVGGSEFFHPPGYGCGAALSGGLTLHWSDADAWGAGIVFGGGVYVGQYEHFIIAVGGNARLTLGGDEDGFDPAAEATAYIEATATF